MYMLEAKDRTEGRTGSCYLFDIIVRGTGNIEEENGLNLCSFYGGQIMQTFSDELLLWSFPFQII